jgi:hypothetical protein
MKKEKGQALPLAMVALAIGAVLIAPFLSHASSSLIGSNDYATIINYRNACDAGVEHAIWRLAYNGLGTSIRNPGDNITYQLAETINGFTPSITVTTNTSNPDVPTGMITGKIDSYEYDSSNCYEPEIKNVSGNVFVTVYRGLSNRGYLKTYSIADDGTITHSVISTYTFDSTACYTPDIIHVSGTYWAIAYHYDSGTTHRGYLKTVNIANNGTITQSTVSSLTFESNGGYEPSIVQVSGVYYAIAYRYSTTSPSANKGYLKTVSISSAGIIGSSAVSSLTFDSNSPGGYEPKIINTSGTYFAILYKDYRNYAMLKTVNISSSGIISSSVVSSYIVDNAQCDWPDMIKISNTVFACIYTCVNNWPDLKTVTISTSGQITQSLIDDAEYVTTLTTPRIIRLYNNIYMICGRGGSGEGNVSTVSIQDNGTITNWTISSYNFDDSYGYEPCVIKVSNDVVAVVYRGAGDDGWVVTIGTEWLQAGSTFTIVATVGNTKIRAYVSVVSGTVTILTWVLQ